MDNAAMAELVRKEVKKKFRGNQKLDTKVAMHFPNNLVREYTRITDAYMRILSETMKEHLPEIEEVLHREEMFRTDDVQSFWDSIKAIFEKISNEVDAKTGLFGLRKRIVKMSNMARRHSVKEWKKVCRATLGIDILEDYYSGDLLQAALYEWVQNNVSLIKTIPQSALGEMMNAVRMGFAEGKSTAWIVGEIKRIYGTEKRHARLIARDQMAKLNADLTMAQQRDAGVEEYIWKTAGDSRVRDRHKELDGKTFKWSELPPIVDIKTGRRAHPGQDYQCRCIAKPKFDIETLNVPFAQKGGD